MEKELFTDDLLWEYADGLLEAAEHQRVSALLRQDPAAEARLDAILLEKKGFSALSLESPKAGFADSVLAAWAMEQAQLQPKRARHTGNDRIVWLIAAIFGLLLFIPLVALLNTSANNTPLKLPAGYELPALRIDWMAILANPVWYYAAGMAFMLFTLRLLDRYLQRHNPWQVA